MSNRTLVELNHDIFDPLRPDTRTALDRFIRSASQDNALALERCGVRVFGTRHHSDGFKISWGAHKAAEPDTGRYLVEDRNGTPLQVGDEVMEAGGFRSKVVALLPDREVTTTAAGRLCVPASSLVLINRRKP